MTAVECLEAGIEKFAERSSRPCGLVDWEDRQRFEQPRLDSEEEAQFDSCCDRAYCGWVSFRDKILRLDHRMENGNEIRSVKEIVDVDASGYMICATHNLINHIDGNTYLEVHESLEDADGNILFEPEVGSPAVGPGDHQDVVLHYQVAYEAKELQAFDPLLQIA